MSDLVGNPEDPAFLCRGSYIFFSLGLGLLVLLCPNKIEALKHKKFEGILNRDLAIMVSINSQLRLTSPSI